MKLNIQLFAYTKKEWKDLPSKDTPILAADLNNIENGIATANINYYNKKEVDEKENNLKAENEYLNSVIEQAFTPVEKEGTSINYDNTINARFKDIKLCGDTTQNGTPTPDAPVPVNVVTGDNTIDICGKNLFDKDNDIVTGYTFGVAGESFSSKDFFYQTKYISVLPNTTYSFTGIKKVNVDSLRVCEYQADKTFIKRNYEVYTITTSENTYYIRVSNYIGKLNTLQLEQGSTATEYEAYKGVSYPISLGVENLWNANNVKKGFLPQSGSYPTTISAYPNARYILVNLLKGQSITISGSTSTMGRVRYIDKDTNQVVGMINNGETEYYKSTGTYVGQFTEGTITAKKDFIVGVMDMSGSVNDLIVKYVSTTPPIELCKIGDYQDYIHKDNGIWYKYGAIGKITLNGTENWRLETSKRFIANLNAGIKANTSTSSTTGALMTHFIEDTPGNTWKNSANAFSIDTTSQVSIRYNTCTTVDELKTWLSTNKPTLYFVLNTPTITEITDTTLLEQLEELAGAKTYAGETNIVATSDGLTIIPKTTALTK